MQTLPKRFKSSTFSSERPPSFFQPVWSPSEGPRYLQRCLTTSGDAHDFEYQAQGNLQVQLHSFSSKCSCSGLMLTPKVWGYDPAHQPNISHGAHHFAALPLPCLGWEQAGERRWKPEAGCFLQQTLKSTVRPENPHLLVMNPPCNHLNTRTRHACEIPEVVAN